MGGAPIIGAPTQVQKTRVSRFSIFFFVCVFLTRVGQGAGGLKAVGEANWHKEVMQSDLPVIIDVNADWCQPCKQLTPLIVKAQAENPDIKFLSLNSDVEERISADLQIKSLPTLLAIFKGKLVEQPLVGLPSPQALSDFIKRVSMAGKQIAQQDQVAQIVDGFLLEGEQALEEGRPDEAAAAFEQAVKAGGPHPAAFAGLCLVALRTGDVKTAEEILKTLKTIKGHEQFPLVKKALGSFELSQALESEMEELKGASFSEGSSDHKYQQAVMMCVSGNVGEAVDSLIDLAKTDRSFGKAKELLIKVFNALGNSHPVAKEGRKKLAQALFM